MKRFKVKIKSKTAYMQDRMNDDKLWDYENLPQSVFKIHNAGENEMQTAFNASYYDSKKEMFYIPSEHINGALINGGAFVKAKISNSRRSLKNVVAGFFEVIPDKIEIGPFDEIDIRSIVNHNARSSSRVLKIRPKWNDLTVEFTLEVDTDDLRNEDIKQVIENGLNRVGIGSFRPQNKGKFGRFEILEFEEIKS